MFLKQLYLLFWFYNLLFIFLVLPLLVIGLIQLLILNIILFFLGSHTNNLSILLFLIIFLNYFLVYLSVISSFFFRIFIIVTGFPELKFFILTVYFILSQCLFYLFLSLEHIIAGQAIFIFRKMELVYSQERRPIIKVIENCFGMFLESCKIKCSTKGLSTIKPDVFAVVDWVRCFAKW